MTTKIIKIKDIEDIETINKICKQPNNRIMDKSLCYYCPLFLGVCCYANIVYLIQQDIEVEYDESK